MEPAFEKLLALLADAGVKFIVIGGVAVTLTGYVRLTSDGLDWRQTDCLGEGFAENGFGH